MSSSYTTTTVYSALGSISAHFVFVVFVGYLFLSQDRPVYPPKKIVKLEIVKKTPLPEKNSIKEVSKPPIQTPSPMKQENLPQIQKPTGILEVTPVKPVTPVVQKMEQNAVQTPSVPTRQLLAKTSVSTRPSHADSIVPRSDPQVQITNSISSSKATVIDNRASRLTQPAPKRRVLQQTKQSVSFLTATKGGGLISGRAKRISAASFQPKAIESHKGSPKNSFKKEGQLINGRAKRINTASLQPKAIQSDKSSQKSSVNHRGQLISDRAKRVRTASFQPKALQSDKGSPKGTSNKGNLLKETASFRMSFPHSSPRKPENVKSNFIKGTVKTASYSSGAEPFAFSKVEPRPVPTIVDPRVLQSYSHGIQSKIAARKKYPRRAKRQGKQGRLTVRFTVLKSGEIKDLILVAKTPFKELNEAGLNAVREAAPFTSLPAEIGQEYLVLELPFKFELK